MCINYANFLAGARSSNCSESSLSHDVIRLVHYDMCFVVCRSRRLSWFSAADVCQSLDGELAPLLIADVQEALVDNIRSLHLAAADDVYWIGLHRTRWVWDATGQLQPYCVKLVFMHHVLFTRDFSCSLV